MTVEDLRNEARYAYDRELAKQNIKVLLKSRLGIEYGGGYFSVTRELISFLSAFVDASNIFILDDYENPIKADPIELLKLCKQRYQEVLNEWADEYDKQSKIRTAKNL